VTALNLTLICAPSAVALLWLGWWVHKRTREDDLAWLAHRGYRLVGPDEAGALGIVKMAHEDDEGWLAGDPIGYAWSPSGARRLVEARMAR
jgi:hypothetical protein